MNFFVDNIAYDYLKKNNKRKGFKMKKIIILLLLLLILPFEGVRALFVNGEKIDFENKITTPANRNFAYMIHDGCEYTVAIPAGAQKLMYPTDMTNPIVLWQTTDYQQSKMDFYQEISSTADYSAKTSFFRKNENGEYYQMYIYELNSYDWVYGEITLNDYYMDSMTRDHRSATVLHEMLHVFGLNDLYSSRNKGSIMYGYDNRDTMVMTADANQVLNNKYN